MAAITRRGKANVAGVSGTIDVMVYPIGQTLKAVQDFELETGKDVQGFDAWLLARNEHSNVDLGIAFIADTAAHSIIPVVAPGSGPGGISTLGQPFLTPLCTINLSGFETSSLNFAGLDGAYIMISGSDLDEANTKVAEGHYKIRKYADSTQNTLLTSAPA